MTEEEISQFTEDKYGNEYLTDPRKGADRWIAIFEILKKYKPSLSPEAEHDIIYLCVNAEETSFEDAFALNRLGCHIDIDYDSGWAKFT